ncbi:MULTISPECIES: carbamoyltransferase HypF [unclassified Burkholderia]|uniref:carbamoyltransferase HypF n=1 Tax=unclassified Burkholderia TaxID=2613784 RepID=UPI000A89B758|nr:MULTISPECIES: carbamoyltransferase HypF [unclassified Burkholderia]
MMKGILRSASEGGALQRLRVTVTGEVQGVGFRPFVYRLAASEGLAGFVRNTGDGVLLEVEGSRVALARFVERLDTEAAGPMHIRERQICEIALQGGNVFQIAPSTREAGHLPVILPDLAVCADCLAEMADPDNRRYRYPFTTCMHCGPRFSIIEGVPYDRARTTMRQFAMCAACRAEYDDSGSRRFHAETNACPRCGPGLMLWDADGRGRATGQQALREAANALRRGEIVAMKGLGGFQLLVDARDEPAVRRLRMRKNRPTKPLAIMAPSGVAVMALADTDAVEQRLLSCAAAPIVLLRSHAHAGLVAPNVAPGNAWLGVMLPYTPLHHLLMGELGFPIVATSGNRGREPIVASEHEALERLGGLADCFLVHDRPIAHPIDDSVVRVIAGESVVLRHARGYAPLDLALSDPEGSDAAGCIALGGHGKSAVAVSSAGRVVLGPYIGDLDASAVREAFARSVDAMTALYGVAPGTAACDMHPDYHSTRFAERDPTRVLHVPHHVAHVLAGMVDNGLDEPVLGVAWDGSGVDGDGTVWGGEFLAIDHRRYRRVAHLQPFRLLGGDAAAREPNRSALGALHAIYGGAALSMTSLRPVAAFAARERQLFAAMLGQGVHSPWTSSAGRLFDAAAAIVGLCAQSSFEGEAAIALEGAAMRAARAHPLDAPVLREEGGAWIADWRPMFASLTEATGECVPAEALARAFHDAFACLVVAVARRIGIRCVLLTGGCFQNAVLAGTTLSQLRAEGFDARCHCRVPPNDGGLAVGQAAFAARRLIEEKC